MGDINQAVHSTLRSVVENKEKLNMTSLVKTGLNVVIYQPTETSDCVIGFAVYKNGTKGTFLQPDNFRKIMNYLEGYVLEKYKTEEYSDYYNPSSFYDKYADYNRVLRILQAHRLSVIKPKDVPELISRLCSCKTGRYFKLCGLNELAVLTRTHQQNTSTFIN